MLFDLSQPKNQPRKVRRSAPFRVEELSRRLMLSDVSTGFPPPELPPPEPPADGTCATPPGATPPANGGGTMP